MLFFFNHISRKIIGRSARWLIWKLSGLKMSAWGCANQYAYFDVYVAIYESVLQISISSLSWRNFTRNKSCVRKFQWSVLRRKKIWDKKKDTEKKRRIARRYLVRAVISNSERDRTDAGAWNIYDDASTIVYTPLVVFQMTQKPVGHASVSGRVSGAFIAAYQFWGYAVRCFTYDPMNSNNRGELP